MILWEYRGTLQALWVLGIVVISWRRGSLPERATAWILMSVILLSWLYRQFFLAAPPWMRAGGYFETDVVYALIDSAGLIALLPIAMLSNRLYPIFITGFQLFATSMHFAGFVMKKEAPFAYGLLNMLPFYFMIGSQTWGLVAHILREKRWGPYPSWRKSFAPSQMMKRT